ncbi:MAG: hypothetical protein U5K54_28675 [Cytophagales bacterium]|nr:hypothetical protein [Cytophagales bacterium]
MEELARALQSFKLAGSTDLPIRKTDYNVNNYLKNRKIHFKVLVTQFSFIVIFKTLITGGLLIMGTYTSGGKTNNTWSICGLRNCNYFDLECS